MTLPLHMVAIGPARSAPVLKSGEKPTPKQIKEIILEGHKDDWFRWTGPAETEEEAKSLALADARTALRIMGAGITGAPCELPEGVGITGCGPAGPMTIPEIKVMPAMREATGRPQDADPVPTPWTGAEAMAAARALVRTLAAARPGEPPEHLSLRVGGTQVKDGGKRLTQDLATLVTPRGGLPDFEALNGPWRTIAIAILLGAMVADGESHGILVAEAAPESATLRALAVQMASERQRRDRAFLRSFLNLAGITEEIPDEL